MCLFSPIRNVPKKHINNFLAPTQPGDNPANLFMFYVFFFGGIKRDKLNGTNRFLQNLRFPAVFCESLRFPAVFCENLHFQMLYFPGNLQKSAKICEKLRIWLRLSHLVCSFSFPLRFSFGGGSFCGQCRRL